MNFGGLSTLQLFEASVLGQKQGIVRFRDGAVAHRRKIHRSNSYVADVVQAAAALDEAPVSVSNQFF